MHLILLSGGSGKRLWPLSNEVRSKQFLKLLPSSNGDLESMVQRVHRQLKAVNNWSSITIAASSTQRDMLYNQLGNEVNIITEPERRDTFPAIALACCYLKSRCNVKDDENIAVLPVDHFVELDYFKTIAEINELLTGDNDLVLMGARPLFPSEKYGYIVPKVRDKRVSAVKYFKEKPEQEVAKKLIDDGAYWNCGVFGLKLGYVLNILENKYSMKIDYEYLYENFNKLKKTSFDYEVVEHAKDIKVIQYIGSWKDLGTWETLSEEMAYESSGLVQHNNMCQNTHIINEQEIPIIAMGIRDAVIVASYDGILVAKKGQTYKLKDLAANLNLRPMYEERRWGSYKVIEHTVYDDGFEALTKKLLINQGQKISYQYHNNRQEIWTVIRGEGVLFMDGNKSIVKAGDTIKIEQGIPHGILAEQTMEILELQLGNPLVEEDIVRLDFDWE